MRFRRNNGSPVSFFAFQDVITGVAGVMLIVVLLLLIGKRRVAAPESAAARPRGVASLETRLAEKERELAAIEERVAALRQAASQRDADQQARRDLQTQTARNEALAKELSKRQREQNELQTLLQKQSAQLAALKPETLDYLQLLDEERKLQRAWRNARLQLAPETRREVAVLDVARSAWRWEQRGQAPVLLGAAASANPTAAWRDLAKRLQRCDRKKALLIVAVRPSAGGFITPLVAKIRAEAPDLPIALEALLSETEGGVKLE